MYLCMETADIKLMAPGLRPILYKGIVEKILNSWRWLIWHDKHQLTGGEAFMIRLLAWRNFFDPWHGRRKHIEELTRRRITKIMSVGRRSDR